VAMACSSAGGDSTAVEDKSQRRAWIRLCKKKRGRGGEPGHASSEGRNLLVR
jgi:hypothetical protein